MQAGRRAFSLPLAFDPFSCMQRFSEEMDRLFEDAGWRRGSAWNQGSSSGWTPRVETFERAGKFVEMDSTGPAQTKRRIAIQEGAQNR
jgi:hypothetical protein